MLGQVWGYEAGTPWWVCSVNPAAPSLQATVSQVHSAARLTLIRMSAFPRQTQLP